MRGRPLRPRSRRRLGEPLPHQLADSPQAPPHAVAFTKRPPFPVLPCRKTDHAVLARVSPGYPPHEDKSLTCYSPVRRSPHTRRCGLPRLACVKHAASVRPEPGSNSPIDKFKQLSLNARSLARPLQQNVLGSAFTDSGPSFVRNTFISTLCAFAPLQEGKPEAGPTRTSSTSIVKQRARQSGAGRAL